MAAICEAMCRCDPSTMRGARARAADRWHPPPMADPEELLKKAGGLFAKVGATLKQTGKQVTGIGRGTVRLELDRTRAAPGETLTGRVVLALPEPARAKRL